MPALFTYGTLRDETVQVATFGRALNSHTDTLSGYRIEMIRINDAAFVAREGNDLQRTLRMTGNAQDIVQGLVVELTDAELDQADRYEPATYERRQVRLISGEKAWVYLHNS